jgi:spore cortex formation protein SpoVR/YcgB (stage V sporulation)
MHTEGLVDDGFIIEFLTSHTNVVAQPAFDSEYYSGINPYALGFAMMTDIRRVCENPTAEDKHWLPDIAGSDWLSTIHYAMKNFRDESFILQFLSPKVIRDFKFFCLQDNDKKTNIEVTAIHDEAGYQQVREQLSQQYNLSHQEPDILVYKVDLRGDRSITLRHYQNQRKPLNNNTKEVLKHVYRLWGYDVCLETLYEGGVIETMHCKSA